MPRGKTLAARSRGLKIPKKGERFGGRQKGTPNQTTREFKEALFLAVARLRMIGLQIANDSSPLSTHGAAPASTVSL
jgi:hypothetical protein